METHFGFAEQMDAVQRGWLQGRYHSDDGERVADLLSFRSVFEINPFEIEASHACERRAYAARKAVIAPILDLRGLMRRPFLSLSNGEMRRVLFARALLKCEGRLVLDDDDPFGGLDASHRAEMRRMLAALRRNGIEVMARPAALAARTGRRVPAQRSSGPTGPATLPSAPVLLEMRHVTVAFGKRVLFRDFAWTVREGERWLLTGPNGSGKTTLLALITGDAPLSYACHIKVFGRVRGTEGVTLAGTRAKIGVVSAERQAYLGETPEEQLVSALAKRPRLLLLDEPCCNLSPAAAKRFLRKVSDWLRAHPRAAAICVAHRPAHVPAGFDRRLALHAKS